MIALFRFPANPRSGRNKKIESCRMEIGTERRPFSHGRIPRRHSSASIGFCNWRRAFQPCRVIGERNVEAIGAACEQHITQRPPLALLTSSLAAQKA